MKRGLQLAGVLFLLLLVLGLLEAQFHLFHTGLFGGPPLGQRELATEVLGRYLAEHYKGKTAIVLSNPFTRTSGQPAEIYQFEKAGLRGLRRGLGTSIRIQAVVFPEVKSEFLKDRRSVSIDPATTTPLSYVVADNALDILTAQHPAAELAVSLIGLPLNVVQTETWKSDKLKFALLLPDLRMVGDQAAILQAIRSGKIAAMVVSKPGAPPEGQPLGRDLKMEFNLHFLLVTPESVDQYLRAYPRLF